MSQLPAGSGNLEGLPTQFIKSLKVLFDILDSKKCGSVKLSELEKRWEEGAVDGLPAGVMGSLKKVATPEGELTFDRFVAGLKMALLRHRSEKSHSSSSKQMRNYTSAPVVGPTKISANKETASNSQPSMPNRATSMPVLQASIPNNHAYKKDNNMPVKNGLRNLDFINYSGNHNRRPGDGRSSIASASALEFLNSKYEKAEEDGMKVANNRRREPRRHTLANGVDHNMIRRIKQFEQEKLILSEGLEMVDNAKKWYENELSTVEEKMKYIGRSDGHAEPSIEAIEERLNLQRARIHELNQQIQALVDSNHKGFALHMNLAVTMSPKRQDSVDKDNVISMLKSQNRQLTKEVTEKSEKISQLEKVKAQLIRKMFEATSEKQKPNYEDTTFI